MLTIKTLPIIKSGFLLPKGRNIINNPMKICKNNHSAEVLKNREIINKADR
jgi:hypothetical protein